MPEPGIVAIFFVCLVVIPICHSYPTSVWQLEEIAKTAAILATVKVEHFSKAGPELRSGSRTVPGRVELVVLRSFPPSALQAGEHIQLDYETFAEGNSGMNGPDVPYFQQGAILVVPLKSNPKLATDAWRLIVNPNSEWRHRAMDPDQCIPCQWHGYPEANDCRF